MPGWTASRLRLEVELWRGPILESRHRLQAVAVGPEGEPYAATEASSRVTTFRSAAKPFQLLPLVERGHADRWGFNEEHLAVMASSHTGSAYHVALVTDILERLGCSDRDLACGFHEPLDAESLAWLRAHADRRSPLYNNCSGKHAGMLALARSEGWPLEGYERREHPVQRLMLETVAGVCGLAPESVQVGIDGCSVCVFGVPLPTMARAFARLAVATAEGDARSHALHRIRTAMQRHPTAMGGAQRFSSALIEASGGRLVAKGGAEGLECIGVPERALGLAIKCEDGHGRAVAPAAVALLEELRLLEPEESARLTTWKLPVIRNHAGIEVGALRARVSALGAQESAPVGAGIPRPEETATDAS